MKSCMSHSPKSSSAGSWLLTLSDTAETGNTCPLGRKSVRIQEGQDIEPPGTQESSLVAFPKHLEIGLGQRVIHKEQEAPSEPTGSCTIFREVGLSRGEMDVHNWRRLQAEAELWISSCRAGREPRAQPVQSPHVAEREIEQMDLLKL